MKVIHFIPSLDKSIGGPARSSSQLVFFLSEQNPKNQYALHSLKCLNPLINEFHLDNAKIIFNKNIREINLDNVDLLHVHGIWSFSIHLLLKKARRKNVPYIISIRGMLEPWSLQQKALKKKLALWVYQRNDLKKALLLHVTSKEEYTSLRSLKFYNPIINIPNGIDQTNFPKKINYLKKFRAKKIIFLSRIHKKKGIELLLNAFSQIDPDVRCNWQIEIIGNGDAAYVKQLKALAIKLDLANAVTFVGYRDGEKKIRSLKNATVFVLPTYSENFGIAIAEALAAFTPVITSTGAPWSDLKEANAGYWIDLSVENLKRSIIKIMTTNFENYREMSQNGKALVSKKYSISKHSKDMALAYDWSLNQSSESPRFVVRD